MGDADGTRTDVNYDFLFHLVVRPLCNFRCSRPGMGKLFESLIT